MEVFSKMLKPWSLGFVYGNLTVLETAIPRNIVNLPSRASTIKVDKDQLKLTKSMTMKLNRIIERV